MHINPVSNDVATIFMTLTWSVMTPTWGCLSSKRWVYLLTQNQDFQFFYLFSNSALRMLKSHWLQLNWSCQRVYRTAPQLFNLVSESPSPVKSIYNFLPNLVNVEWLQHSEVEPKPLLWKIACNPLTHISKLLSLVLRRLLALFQTVFYNFMADGT